MTRRRRYHIRDAVLSNYTDAFFALDMVVISARSPFDMILHCAHQVDELEFIENDLDDMYDALDNRYPEEPYPKLLKKRQCYSLYSPRKRRWVRARATESVGPDMMNMKTCFELVDYACLEILPAHHARYIPDKHCKLPAMGFRAQLDEAQPEPWPTRASDCYDFRARVMGEGKEFYCYLINYSHRTRMYTLLIYDAPYEPPRNEGENPRKCNEGNKIRALPAAAYPRSNAPAPVVARRNEVCEEP